VGVEDLQKMSLAFLIAAGVLLVTSIILFFVFNVPKLVNEVTGRAEKKAIAQFQKKNEQDGERTNEHTGMSEQLAELPVDENISHSETVKLPTRKLETPQDTTVLNTNSIQKSVERQSTQEELPVLSPDTEFVILEEFSFTSSTEVIE